ncbi:MAG: gliding motility-associated C-terminal domain-containing protein [Chitinophagaceae bacterium]|nr:gliding motility-associated C-terminal domain-containing protein [Chitinophagaceae bacterium]
MSQKTICIVFTCLLSLLYNTRSLGQSFGAHSSAILLTNCTQSSFYNISGTGTHLIGPVDNLFPGADLGMYTQNSGGLIIRGAEIRSFKTPGVANICNVRMYYRTYLASAAPGSYNSIDIPLVENCDVPNSVYASGGSCVDGDSKWSIVIPDGETIPYAPVDLTAMAQGNYILEVYFELTGSATTTTACDEINMVNNGGDNFKASYSIDLPVLSSNNPITCNGTEGSVTIGGLVPGAIYGINYMDDDLLTGPVDLTTNGSGQVIISGLNAGVYSGFSISINGCVTELNTGLILSNPVLTPTFNKISPICAGNTAPLLATTSNNGVSGSWNPAVINNQQSGSYRFTPDAGECGLPVTINVVVNPRVTPTFVFGTSLTICADGTVPTLSTTSSNSIIGIWSPAIVDKQNSRTYTFTPTAGQCATSATFTVTVNPNITPAFSFGTSLTICADASTPALPATSTNSVTGTWNPSTIDNQNSGTYTFTPTAGLCATSTTLTVTVNPNETPTFDFGTSLTICAGGTVPTLPTTSDNGITGTWSPASVSNQTSATYTFTPTSGLCATTATFTVTVAPNITPTFDFGISLTICADATVPALPTTSLNNISGTWNVASVDNQNSGTYTFTPTAGQCATTAAFNVTVNPNITPVFSFGTSLTICADDTAPALPATSTNSISGTWDPATINNQNSGTYTFTPAAGLCATSTTLSVTVNPNITPTFDFGTAISVCAGDDAIPNLSATSSNGITGSWNPSVVSNQVSGVYTFTPASGLCASSATFTVTVNANEVPTFVFGTALSICSGETVPVLPATSENNITGTWYPAEISNTSSDTYTFLPDLGFCATPAEFTVTVALNITPTFSFGTNQTICEDANAPLLPATSTNNITGTWNPAVVSNQASEIYTFTPGAGQCATSATFTVTVNPNEIPTFSFGSSLTICAGETVPALPTTSDNEISGIWSPASIDNQNSATYTFTPGGGCASPTTFNVTVTPNVIPTFDFGTSLTICAEGAVPTLPNTSVNSITGTWNPAVVNNQASGTYTFTPTAGICATTSIFTVTVNPNLTPTFDFGTSLTICAETTAPLLPTTSTNNITGTWNPSTIDNENSGTYTFTPTAGLCATVTTLTVSISPNETPAFSFGSSLTICAGETVPALPNTSDNGITGTWSPSGIDDQNSGTYTFTPASGQCATTVTFTVTVTPNITPTFTFGTSLTICAEDFVPALPTISENGITGTWNPTEINKQASGIYTFIPDAGVCATNAIFTVTVNQNVLPIFDFGTTMTVCSDSTVPELPTVSTNGIIGTWSPATVDNQASGTYTFTPAAGSCGTMTTFTVTVTQSIAPIFDFEPNLVICTGGDVPTLPAKSTNDIEGTWEPALADNQASGVYTFTPDATPEQCIGKFTLIVTVNPILEPTFNFGTTLSLCRGTAAPLLSTTSANGITGTWNPAEINNQASGTYTFTTTPGQCATEEATLVVTVNDIPTINQVSNNTVNDGITIPANNLSGTPANIVYNWTNSNPSIGLVATGTGNIPSYTATNQGNAPISGTITVTPMNNGCSGTTLSYVVTVNPLDKDVFVPNVFTPNADGKNDILYVYSNYITELEMRIFNQYGQEIHMINNVSRGWDGTHRGKQQPVGVYVYTLRAVLTDGRIIKSKGSITLLR